MEQAIAEKARRWALPPFDAETRQAVSDMIASRPDELAESFYTDLEFGTGGLRGIMGPGTNRMNIYTVGMASQGFANYLMKVWGEGQGTGDSPTPLTLHPASRLTAQSTIGHQQLTISVAIAHDCRHNSALFARKTAEVFAANGIRAYLFTGLRTTPELSFAIRHLGCKGGVVITASHNPPEYNGYKAYWADGGQLVSPHDTNVITEVKAISGPEQVRWDADERLIVPIDKEIDDAYERAVLSLCLSPEAVRSQKGMKVVFTSLHGTAITMVPRCLAALGFDRVHVVREQAEPDGNFPTVKSPNPEEADALRMALEQAEAIGADLVMGCDPDADRVGIAVRNPEGQLELLNGNMTGSLLLHYLITRWQELGRLDGRQFTAKTIVTTDLFERVSEAANVPCFNVLTGFKYIGELILRHEGNLQFIGGGEESYGYLAGDLVRDKDAVLACTLIAEMCAWAKQQGKTLYDVLIDIYMQHGLYVEGLVSLTKKGRTGQEEIAAMMEHLRITPPRMLDGSGVILVKDFKQQTVTDLRTGERSATGLPKSNVLQFIAEDGTVVTARPSGTEPKIKFYFSVNGRLGSRDELRAGQAALRDKLERIGAALGLG